MRASTALALLLLLPAVSVAGFPTDAEREKLVGTPNELVVSSPEVSLVGPRAAHQLVLTGKYSNAQTRDLTPVATASVEPADVVEVQQGLFLRAKKDGTATLTLAAGGKTATVKVTVKDSAAGTPPSFRHDVVTVSHASASIANSASVSPSAFNGLRLSRVLIMRPGVCRGPHDSAIAFAPTAWEHDRS